MDSPSKVNRYFDLPWTHPPKPQPPPPLHLFFFFKHSVSKMVGFIIVSIIITPKHYSTQTLLDTKGLSGLKDVNLST